PGLFPVSEVDEEGLHADVLWVDRYGNAQLNVEPTELDALGDRFELRGEGRPRTARRVHHFAELGTGEIGLLVDSYGFIAIVADKTSAAEELSLGASDGVTLVPLGDDEVARPGATTPVQLSAPPGRAGAED